MIQTNLPDTNPVEFSYGTDGSIVQHRGHLPRDLDGRPFLPAGSVVTGTGRFDDRTGAPIFSATLPDPEYTPTNALGDFENPEPYLTIGSHASRALFQVRKFLDLV